MAGVVAVGLDAALADLQQEFSVLVEFEDMPVAVAIAGEPDIVLIVDEDAVLAAARTAVAIGAPLFGAGLAFHMRRKEAAAIEPLILPATREMAGAPYGRDVSGHGLPCPPGPGPVPGVLSPTVLTGRSSSALSQRGSRPTAPLVDHQGERVEHAVAGRDGDRLLARGRRGGGSPERDRVRDVAGDPQESRGAGAPGPAEQRQGRDRHVPPGVGEGEPRRRQPRVRRVVELGPQGVAAGAAQAL